MVTNNELWIHQESTVISANSHDIWRFTPEFLITSDIVPESWVCAQATQSPDMVMIEIGPVQWRMTREQLWITGYPDCPLSHVIEDTDPLLTSSVASNFLEATPYLPSQILWMFWQISAVIPDRDLWLLENFLSKGWPTAFGSVDLQPQLTVSLDDFAIQITVRNSFVQRRGQPQPLATIFDCYAWRTANQSPREMVSELEQGKGKLRLTELAIRHLSGNRI